MPSKPGCTLITDASFFCSGVAGWAAWARADEVESCSWEGPIAQTWIRTAADAELAAIVLGMRACRDYAPGHRLMVQSDCMRALRVLRQELGWEQRRHPDGQDVAGRVADGYTDAERKLVAQAEIIAQSFAAVSIRHVKGHVPRIQGQGRHRANAQCDERAKWQMRELRQRFVEAQEAQARGKAVLQQA